MRITIRTLGLPGLSASDADQAIRDTQETIEQYEETNKKYRSLSITPGQKELHDKVDAAWQDFKSTGATAISLYRSGNPEDRQKMVDIFFTDCPEKAKTYTNAVNALVNFHRKAGNSKTLEANKTASNAYYTLAILTSFAIALGLGIAITFSYYLSKTLQGTVELLSSGASQVNIEISQLSHSAGELSTAANQQAAAIQETSASIEEIRAMVEKNSQNATDSAASSRMSKERAERGQQVVSEMIESMAQIEKSNQGIMDEIIEGNRRIAEIVQLIQEVGNKTTVINDIVFQTKLLSFNASVEAARAGEHGKGFAVVAEEIGNLAQMSGNAAKEISEMLSRSVTRVEGIVRDTKDRVESLIQGAKVTVDRGGEVAKQCGDVLGEIVKNARHVSDMVREISTASQEQSRGIVEIARAIQELDLSTQTKQANSKTTADRPNTSWIRLRISQVTHENTSQTKSDF